jgi:hypothetical protein
MPPTSVNVVRRFYFSTERAVLIGLKSAMGSPFGQLEAIMDEIPSITAGSRRNEDIALDMMKFIAMTTGYGRTSGSGVGFQGGAAASKPEDYATHLLELYGRCLGAVQRK